MWDQETERLKFQIFEPIWSQEPFFFHGRIVGFFVVDGVCWYICQSLQGTIIHLEEKNLSRPKKIFPFIYNHS